MDSITLNGYAKINLGLDVLGCLPNGYHEVKMIMQSINLYDTITISTTDDNDIILKSDNANLPTNRDNLIYKAARLILDESKVNTGLKISLTKRIPMAAGMAGGSTDAAATLIGINKLLNLNYTQQKLRELGVKIGADVPYCIMLGTALSEGIGEKLTSLTPMPECHILIAKPDIDVSTALVYKKLDSVPSYNHPDIDGMCEALSNNSLTGITDRMANVLEEVTVSEYPVINTIKNDMLRLKARNSLMSGSGPTVFGIYDNITDAKNAFFTMKELDYVKDIFLTEPYTPDL